MKLKAWVKKIKKFRLEMSIIAVLVLALVSVVTWGVIKSHQKKQPYLADTTIPENAEDIFTDDARLYSYVKKFGPAQTVARLNELSAKYGSCHTAAHTAGHFAYDIYGASAFKQCGIECQSGCYHGLMESYFRDHGTNNLQAALNSICGDLSNPFIAHQCFHGLGHGLMAWTNYELPDALQSCDLLEKGQDSCWTGVFMENIVGTLGKETGHETKYLSSDPQYPCNAVDEKYKWDCYFLQTSKMITLFNNDFVQVARACDQAPQRDKQSCFESMGRDVDNLHHDSVADSIEICRDAPKQDQIFCFRGAEEDAFWDVTLEDRSLSYCTLLTDPKEKADCYVTLFARAPQILNNDQLASFCKKVEPDYQKTCPLTSIPQ